jgi:hypothetical protein
MKSKVFIRLEDKGTHQKSELVPIEEIIYHQDEIEFEFKETKNADYGSLPYNDFLFFQDDYKLSIIVKEK